MSTDQPGPYYVMPALPEHDDHPDPWPYFWPDGQRARPGVVPEPVPSWVIARTVIGQPGDELATVSTLFTGEDVSEDEGAPVLWETHLFDSGAHTTVLGRYSSREEALTGHARAVAAEEGAYL